MNVLLEHIRYVIDAPRYGKFLCLVQEITLLEYYNKYHQYTNRLRREKPNKSLVEFVTVIFKRRGEHRNVSIVFITVIVPSV